MKKLIYILALLPTILFSQHSINGTFSPAEEFTYAFLYRSSPTGSDYVNRAKLESDGSFKIELDASNTAGIYKIVYATPPEDNNFDFIYNGKEDVDFTFNLDNGINFTNSNENKLWNSYIKSISLINTAISNFYVKESTDKNAFKDIFHTLLDTQKSYEQASEGTLAHTFIKANTPYIPEQFEDLSSYSKNIKRTYLQHVNFENELLQSSDFLTQRVMAYIFAMSANATNDAFIKDINTLVEAIGNNTIVKLTLLQTLWQRFAELENETLANYISDTYLLDLAKQTNYKALIDALTTYKNSALGEVAQNFEIAFTENEKNITTTLHDLNIAENYLLIFWSSTCGHCLDELPKVRELIATKPKLKVIAIGMEDDLEHWQNEIKNYPNFIHVLGLGKWDNTTVKAYGIKSTPSYFLLDETKKIIAKPYDFEVLKTELKTH